MADYLYGKSLTGQHKVRKQQTERRRKLIEREEENEKKSFRNVKYERQNHRLVSVPLTSYLASCMPTSTTKNDNDVGFGGSRERERKKEKKNQVK